MLLQEQEVPFRGATAELVGR